MIAAKPRLALLPVLSLLYSATLWGVVWYPLRLLDAAGLSGLWTSLVSYGTALLLLSRVFVHERAVLRRNAPALFMLVLASGWCNVAFIMAILDGHVVRVLLLFYLSPFWAVCLGWLMLGERLDRPSLVVFLVAVVGALIMLWNEDIGMPWPHDSADWLAVSSGFAFALSNVFVRHLQDISVWLKSVCNWLGVVLVALAWIAASAAPLPAVAPAVYAGGVLLGIFGFLTMTVAVQYGVTRMPVHRSAVILLFELVVGALSALWLTDEQVLLREWIGGILIVSAAWLAARLHVGEHA